jgi:hypothetical protein
VDDEQARKERADQLHEDIEALKSGRERPPRSPREFTDEEARKEREAESTDDGDS